MRKILYFIAMASLLCCCTKDESGTEKLGSIHGTITDKATGELIRSAGVQLNPVGIKTITGNDGQYEFTDLKAGEYTLQVTKTGYNDLANHKITVVSGKSNQGSVQMEKLPPSLRVVNDNKPPQDINELDFGSAEADVTRSFSIFNDGPEKLEWEITKTSEWISGISKTGGTLNAGATQAIIVTVNRSKLASGGNTTTIHITSDNGSKDLTIKVTNGRKAPVLNTLATTNIAATTATFNGEIMDAGSPAYTERGFVYSTITNPSLKNTIAKRTVEVTGIAKFSTNVLGLTLGNIYFVRAYAINSVDTVYSTNEVSFTTATVLPTLSTQAVSNISITNKRATFNGTILTNGDPVYTERGFVYGTVHNPTVEDDTKKIAPGNGIGAFSVNATGITEGTMYYVRAYATNAAGTAYGEEITLNFNAVMPMVTTQDVTEITGTTATLNGTIVSVGDPAYTERGFVYGTLRNPTIEDNSKKIVSGTSTGAYNANITGLTIGTLLYIRAYATTSKGTAYGGEVSFTPSNPNVVILQASKLMVQKTDIGTGYWSTMNSLCNNSILDGYTDWRMPTKDELAVLYNERNKIGGFTTSGTYSYYWSSTYGVAGNYYYWWQNFSNGGQSTYTSGNYYHSCRCVRTLP